MRNKWKLPDQKKNFVFLGEAGSGKSEIAVNLACILAENEESGKEVHFFDLDQTKPLFRSRDVKDQLERNRVQVHFEQQLLDAPTMAGGVGRCLQDEKCLTILDVGGNQAGARMIGGFSGFLNQDNTEVCFVINPYRPWSKDVISIDQTLSSILKVSHVRKVTIISNPNLGETTEVEEVLEGHKKVLNIIEEFLPVSCLCVRKDLYQQVREKTQTPIFPLDLRMQYKDI